MADAVELAARALLLRYGCPPPAREGQTNPHDQFSSPASTRGELGAGRESKPITIQSLQPSRVYCSWGFVWNRGPGEMLAIFTGPDGKRWELPLDPGVLFPTAGFFWASMTLQNVSAADALRYVVVAR